MTFQRKLWGETLKNNPSYPCPNCENGRLGAAKISECTIAGFRNKPPRHRLFVCGLECDSCGQLVAVQGYERKSGRIPKAMCPAPPIICAPAKTPSNVTRELELAFSLFWVDLGACANKLRISVERVLDYFRITGGTLANRVARFQAVDAGQAKTFDALRQVGNVGSHLGSNTRETILDAFEVYEHALEELFGDRKSYFDRLRKKIIEKNGR
jgi:Domain of unknown function (DUF4145)